MATASKHKQRSSRKYRQRPNFERFFVAHAQKAHIKSVIAEAMLRRLFTNNTEAEDENV